MGRTVIFETGPVTLLISELRGVAGNLPDVYRAFGIEPADYKMAVLKTASNFQFFAPITSRVIRADTRGPGQSDVFTLPWKRLPRPIYPLDADRRRNCRAGLIAGRRSAHAPKQTNQQTQAGHDAGSAMDARSWPRARRSRLSLASPRRSARAAASARHAARRPSSPTSAISIPIQFSSVNFPLIKNLYDSLIEYTPEGKAVPSLADRLDRSRPTTSP